MIRWSTLKPGESFIEESVRVALEEAFPGRPIWWLHRIAYQVGYPCMVWEAEPLINRIRTEIELGANNAATT